MLLFSLLFTNISSTKYVSYSMHILISTNYRCLITQARAAHKAFNNIINFSRVQKLNNTRFFFLETITFYHGLFSVIVINFIPIYILHI